MYYKRKTICSQQIQIIIFIIKKPLFYFQIHTKQTTEFWIHLRSSWISGDLHPQSRIFSTIKNRKCIKITANINNWQLEWNRELEKAPPHKRNFAQQKTVTIHEFSTKNNYQLIVMYFNVNIQWSIESY